MKSIGNIFLLLLLCLRASAGVIVVNADSIALTHLKLADYYLEYFQFDSAEIYYSKALPLLATFDEREVHAKALNNYAASLYWQSRFIEAEACCRENLETCIEWFGYDHPISADALMNLGILGFMSERFGLKNNYVKLAASIYKNEYGLYHPKVAKAYEWLGAMHEANADTLIAREYLWKSYDIWKKIRGADHVDLAYVYRYMGLYNWRFMFHDEAIRDFKKAKELFDKKHGRANFESVRSMINLASMYSDNPAWHHKVGPIYDHCFELLDELPSPVPIVESMVLFNYSFYHQNILKEPVRSIELLNQALHVYYPGFDYTNIFQNPVITKEGTNRSTRLALIFKARFLYYMFLDHPTPDGRWLDAAMECLDLHNQAAAMMKQRLINLDDFLVTGNAFAHVYYSMAKKAYTAYNHTNEPGYLDRIIHFLEQKAWVDMFVEPELALVDYYDFSPEFSTNRLNFLERTNNLKTQLHQADSPDQRNAIELMISKENIELDRFYYYALRQQHLLQKDYKKRPSIKIADIQDLLAPDESILYFNENKVNHEYLPQELLIMGISKNDIRMEVIEGEQVFRMVNQLYDLAAARQPDGLVELTDELYTLLIRPFEGLLRERLVVIQSPVLSRLSFDMLTKPGITVNGRPAYLIKDHLVRRELSLSDFITHRHYEPVTCPMRVLAVAPQFNNEQKKELAALVNRDTSLVNLPGALIESHNIANYFPLKLLTGASATKDKFLELYEDYPVIHLSTHGVPAKNDPGIIQLAFSPGADAGGGSNNMLSMYEVLNMRLGSSLVVLSACRTGHGNINHSQGSLSLSWAFMKAGARSSVISLWDVNDYASSHIMNTFYSLLAQGVSKPEALRSARLEYLRSHDELMQHPFYWAGFQYYGDAGSLVAAKTKFSITWLLAVMLLGGLAAYVIYRKH